MDPHIFEQRVEIRMRRQEVLGNQNQPRYRVLLDEAVLHRRVGGGTLMAVQLEKILEAGRSGKATIQVIPFDVGILAVQDSNFVLLEFDETPNMAPIIFVEGLTGNQYLERETDIVRYSEAIEHLHDSAFSPQRSIDYIDTFLNHYVNE
jgi:hypothetical protein